MKRFKLAFLISVITLSYACKNSDKNLVYNKLVTTTFDCFCDSLKYETGKKVVCEPSAVVFYNDTVYFASDRAMPNSSSVFKMSFDTAPVLNSIKFLTDSALIGGCKYEDFSLSPNSKFVFLSCGFDRIKPDDNSWDCFNNIYYWETKGVCKPKLIVQNNDSVAKSSKYLRKIFACLIDTVNYKNGVPYFKIEGMAAIPGDTLLFGVREYGNSYEDFKNCMKIIAIPYKIENDKLIMLEDAKLIFDYKPNEHKKYNISKTIGISSIEYNRFDKKLYILTSYELGEKSEDVGAYLWTITLDDLRKNKKPAIVLNPKGKALHLAHKAEGITIINDKTLLVINDDDRIYGPEKITDSTKQFKRKQNQAAYTILELQTEK